MDADEAYRSVAAALREAVEARGRAERQLADLRGRFDQLVDVLAGKGLLAEGHRKVLDRAGAAAAGAVKPRVRLRAWVDKYRIPNADVDCAALYPLCHARCCSLSFELTTQDLDEGVVRWEVEEPYLIRHEADGYCSHLDRATGGCGVYARRPATCRGYDCRGDRRIWADFDRRIPAPLP